MEREAARNNLESYIMDAQDRLYQEEYEAASTEEQRQVIRDLCSKVCIELLVCLEKHNAQWFSCVLLEVV